MEYLMRYKETVEKNVIIEAENQQEAKEPL